MATQGKPRWYKPDAGLAARMVLTMFLLGAVYVVFVGVSGCLQHAAGRCSCYRRPGDRRLPVLLRRQDRAGLDGRASGRSSRRPPSCTMIIGRLAAQANLPKPKIAIVNTSIPNAFATGRDKNHAVVAVTTGISATASQPELEAVLAHEMTHIINRDMLVMTIATFFSMVLSLIMQTDVDRRMFGGFGGGYGRRRGNHDKDGAFIYRAARLGRHLRISFLLIRALSRYRELAADRGSALITGAPEHLASALHAHQRHHPEVARIPQHDFRQAQAVNALFIVPALQGRLAGTLLSTHPSTRGAHRAAAARCSADGAGALTA